MYDPHTTQIIDLGCIAMDFNEKSGLEGYHHTDPSQYDGSERFRYGQMPRPRIAPCEEIVRAMSGAELRELSDLAQATAYTPERHARFFSSDDDLKEDRIHMSLSAVRMAEILAAKALETGVRSEDELASILAGQITEQNEASLTQLDDGKTPVLSRLKQRALGMQGAAR